MISAPATASANLVGSPGDRRRRRVQPDLTAQRLARQFGVPLAHVRTARIGDVQEIDRFAGGDRTCCGLWRRDVLGGDDVGADLPGSPVEGHDPDAAVGREVEVRDAAAGEEWLPRLAVEAGHAIAGASPATVDGSVTLAVAMVALTQALPSGATLSMSVGAFHSPRWPPHVPTPSAAVNVVQPCSSSRVRLWCCTNGSPAVHTVPPSGVMPTGWVIGVGSPG